jgi:hypothetical protein
MFDTRSVHVRVVVEIVAVGHFSLSRPNVCFPLSVSFHRCPILIFMYMYTIRTNGRILGTFQRQCSSVYRSVLDNKEQMGVRGELYVPAALPREKSVGRRLLGGCGITADPVWTLKKSYLPLSGI